MGSSLIGGNIYKILEEVIILYSNEQKHYQEIINSGTLKQQIIVSKEQFDGIIEKGTL